MDTPTDSSGALDTNQAANLFAQMLDPQPEADKDDSAQEAKIDEVTAEAAEEAQPETETESPDDPTVTVKIDGRDVEVKLSELKRGYQKDASANQRFEQAAELRKQADAETQKAQADRRVYAENLQRMQAQLEGALQTQQQTDWDALLQSDPVEYLRQQRLAQERQALLQRTYAERQNLAQADQAERLTAHQNYLVEQSNVLLDKLPEWRDESKAKAEQAALREYLLSQGYNNQSVDSVSDAKAVILARKAMLFDQMMVKAQAAQKKVSTLPTKVERSGTGESPGLDRRTAAFQKLSKSGRVEDAAAVFAGIL